MMHSSLAGPALSSSVGDQWVLGCIYMNKWAEPHLIFEIKLSGPTGWPLYSPDICCNPPTAVILILEKKKCFFPMQQHMIRTPYLICFTCDKKDTNQKTKLESVECFCTAFWDLKSFPHLSPPSHEPPEIAGRLTLL